MMSIHVNKSSVKFYYTSLVLRFEPIMVPCFLYDFQFIFFLTVGISLFINFILEHYLIEKNKYYQLIFLIITSFAYNIFLCGVFFFTAFYYHPQRPISFYDTKFCILILAYFVNSSFICIIGRGFAFLFDMFSKNKIIE
jgi:hypothetical protein